MYGLQVLGAFEKLETLLKDSVFLTDHIGFGAFEKLATLLKDSVFLTDHIGLQGILNYKTETALKT